MKNKAVYIIVILALLASAISALYKYSPLFPNSEVSGLPENFNTLSRQDQVLVCASCHPKQYENEMAGPHANAYSKLMLHINELKSTNYPHQFYSSFINGLNDKACTSCHATDNLFESYFTSADSAHPKQRKENQPFPLPSSRVDKSSFSTGVDCITCHYDGKNVLAGNGFNTTLALDEKLTCNPKKSIVLSSDISCMPCHPDNRVSETSLYYQGISDKDNCISCHQERAKTGKGTHYYYWKYDSKERAEANPMLTFYAPKKISLKGNTALIRWKNTQLPHATGQCPEMVISIDVQDGEGKSKGNANLRFNRRDYYGAKMLQFFGGNQLPGISGILPMLNSTDTVLEIPLTDVNPNSPLFVDVKGLSKTQYWIEDSLGVIRYRHRSRIQ